MIAAVVMLTTAALMTASGASLASDAPVVRIARGDCMQLTAHRPDDDVAYRPGIDVRGRPVAPADLGGGGRLAVGDIAIPIEIPLARRYGVAAGRYAATAEVGTVTLRGDEVLFNGRPMSDVDQALIAQACRAAGVAPP